MRPTAPSARSRILLSVDRARKQFRGRTVLDGLSFELRVGEWVGLVGPNGAGKTTLMRALAGLLDLDGGEIVFLDEPGGSATDGNRRSGLGLIPQEIALYGALSARENLQVFARFHGVPRRRVDERVDWALAWTGLEPRADDRVATYSGGMQRRLNIACGVLHGPRVILLDEPTVGVDPQGRSRIWEMLEGLRRDGAALLQTSHQLAEIQARCDRMLIVDRGRCLAEGSLAELAAGLDLPPHLLRLTLDRSTGPAGLGTDLLPGLEVRGDAVSAPLTDVPGELEIILGRIREAGLGVSDIRLETPGLEQIFTRLTGRGLRE